MPIVPLNKAGEHRHNVARGSFIQDPDGGFSPKPAPILSETPGQAKPMQTLIPGQHTEQILKEFGFDNDAVKRCRDSGAIDQADASAKL